VCAAHVPATSQNQHGSRDSTQKSSQKTSPLEFPEWKTMSTQKSRRFCVETRCGSTQKVSRKALLMPEKKCQQKSIRFCVETKRVSTQKVSRKHHCLNGKLC